MTSVADLVVTHIDTYWDPEITPKPKIAKVIAMPLEKQLGESILVELINQRWDPINSEYSNEVCRLAIRIYTNKTDDRLTNFANEVDRIFANYTVSGYDVNIITATDDVSERQRNSFVQVKTAELTRLSVYRGVPVSGTPPSRNDLMDATFVTIADEAARAPYSVRHLNVTESEKHTPKQHELGGDRHLQTQPLVLSQSLTVQNNAIITGNLTVQGTQTVLETTILQVEDPVVTLNKGETGAGITSGLGGIEIDRGSLSYAQILFDEANDRFVLRYGDATKIPLELDSVLGLDADRANYLGKARIGTPVSLPNFAVFMHRAFADVSPPPWNYALAHESDGNTYLNTSSGKAIRLCINGSAVTLIDASGQKWGSYYITSAFLVADDKVADSDKWDGYHQSDIPAKRTIILTAGGGIPSTTSGCSDPTKVEMTTNKQNVMVLDFDPSTIEYACWVFPMPDNYDGGTITAQLIWTAASGSGNVKWDIQGRSYADDEAIDQAWGTAQEVTDTLLSANDVHVSPATSAITLGGTPAAGELVMVRAYRNASDAGDTLAVDARLIGVKIIYSVNKFSDQ